MEEQHWLKNQSTQVVQTQTSLVSFRRVDDHRAKGFGLGLKLALPRYLKVSGLGVGCAFTGRPQTVPRSSTLASIVKGCKNSTN